MNSIRAKLSPHAKVSWLFKFDTYSCKEIDSFMIKFL